MRRTPGSRPLTGSTRRIDTLRPTTAGSRPFTPDSAERHPSHAPVAPIETLDRLHTADRHPFGPPPPDRDPSRRMARKDALPMRRTPGSRPRTGSTQRIDTLRPTTAGSRPFTPVGADRHPSYAPDARAETPDRLDTADRQPSAHYCRIETLHNGRRGKTPFPCAGRPDRDPGPAPHGGSTPFGPPPPDRDPSRRTARIDTLLVRRTPGSRPSTASTPRGGAFSLPKSGTFSLPAHNAGRRGSTPFPCAGRSGRAPARLPTRIEPFALEGPLDPDPRHRLRTLHP